MNDANGHMIIHELKAGKIYFLRMFSESYINAFFYIKLEKLHLCIDADADGICDECNSVIEVELTLNQTKTVAYPEVNVCNPVYLKFTPNGSGEYFLTPAPMEAMQISLYASDKTTKLDFERMGADCVCTLEAGQTYYFKTNYIANNGVGEAEFTLICQHLTKTTVPAVTQPTCLIPAYNEHQVCTTCGEKFGYIETAPRLSHSGTPTYTWSDDNSTCTAEIACTNGDPHTETETVESVSVITQTASCESKELTRYTATFTNATFEQQIKENVETADSLGHDVSSEWSKDEMHHWHTCSRCDYTEGMAEHTFNEQNDCTICGAHVHYECGAVCTHEGEQAHANVAWQALPEDFIGGVLATGNYYLDRDIQLSAPITFNSDAVVNFCLNGYVLKAPTTGDNCSVFFIDSENGSQTITNHPRRCSYEEI